MHGFKDVDADTLSTYAATASKWTQRLVLAIASQMRWELISADVSSAFIRGLTFSEMSKLTGKEIRSASFSPPKGCEDVIRKLPGFEGYDPTQHEIVMLKPIYWSMDAPRAWRVRLHQALTQLQGKSLACDSALYAWYHDADSSGKPRLCLICSAHVDDLKIAGTPAAITRLLAGLEAVFGALAVQRGKFEHCGIMHEQHADFSITMHQNHYAKNLFAIPTTDV